MNTLLGYLKKAVSKVIEWLCAIEKDKYQHFAVGAVLGAVALLVPQLLGVRGWLSLLISVTVVTAAAVVKERKIDPTADLHDIFATLAGGTVVWAVGGIVYLL